MAAPGTWLLACAAAAHLLAAASATAVGKCIAVDEDGNFTIVEADACPMGCCVEGTCREDEACAGHEEGGGDGSYVIAAVGCSVAALVIIGVCAACLAEMKKRKRDRAVTRTSGALTQVGSLQPMGHARQYPNGGAEGRPPSDAETPTGALDHTMPKPKDTTQGKSAWRRGSGSTPAPWGIRKWVSKVKPFDENAAPAAADPTQDDGKAAKERDNTSSGGSGDEGMKRPDKEPPLPPPPATPTKTLPKKLLEWGFGGGKKKDGVTKRAVIPLPALPPPPGEEGVVKNNDRDRDITATAPADDPLQNIILDMNDMRAESASPVRPRGSDSSSNNNHVEVDIALWEEAGLHAADPDGDMDATTPIPHDIPDSDSDDREEKRREAARVAAAAQP